MSIVSYDESLRRLLLHEGGYTNHPRDPGGPTNFGITIYDFRKYVMPGATADDVRRMKLEDAKVIYRAKYWDAMRCSDLEPGVDYAMFDYGVNSGVGRAGKVLRRLVGLPDSTSEVTPEVIRTAQAVMSAQLVGMICDERIRFLKRLSTWPVFGGGWGRRVSEVRNYATSIAQDIPMIEGPPIVPARGRAIEIRTANAVRALQQSLLARGFDPGAIDGDLGPKTVKAFQKSARLKADGVVGKKTGPLLDAALDEVMRLASGEYHGP